MKKDLQPERWHRMRRMLRRKGVVHLNELCREFDVSAATVRRDLEALENMGELRRVHGGAVSAGPELAELLFDEKTKIAAREKRRIARAAAALVEPEHTVFLDGGSTVLELARLLRDRSDVTVVTNSLRAALELGSGGPRLILIGGELRRRSQTIVGSLTSLMIEGLHVDMAFMGTLGMAAKEGLTTTDPDEAFTKRQVMAQAGQVVLLADGSKVGKVLFSKAGDVSDIDILITDENIRPAFVKNLKKRGVRIVET